MTDDSPSTARWPQRVIVMIMVSLAVLGLAEATVYFPAVVRKILLFSIAFGVATGFLLSLWARHADIPKVIALPHAGLLILVGLSLIAARSYQHLRDELAEASGKNPQGMFDTAVARQLAADDPELAESLKQRRQLQDPTFADYLAIRIRPLGEWSQPWPSLFWAGELVLATLAGVFIVHRRLSATADETEQAA